LLTLLTASMFVLVAAVTGLLSFRLLNLRGRYLDRLAARAKTVSPFLPSPSLIWRELVAWIGMFVPAAPKDLPRLKRRLIRAGFRNPSAVRAFHGTRAISTVVLCLAAFFGGLRFYVTTQNLILLTGAGLFVGYQLPMQYLLLCIRRRQRAVEKGLPNALDLMVVCVEAGLGLDQTTLQVAKELQSANPEICEEFAVMNLEMRAGKRRVEALHNLADRTGVAELKKLVAVLIQTDRFGTSIASALRIHADTLRQNRHHAAEELAAKASVKMSFPLVLFIFPATFIVLAGPTVIGLMNSPLLQ